jgi:glycosyltransferase involved in cell wall biosynthesis
MDKATIKLLYLTGPRVFATEKMKLVAQGSKHKTFFDFAMTHMSEYSIEVDFMELNSWGAISVLAQSLKILVLKKKYDAILTTTGTGLFLALSRFLLRWKRPYLCEILWQVDVSGKQFRPILDKLLKITLRSNVDRIICVVSSQKKSFSQTLLIPESRVLYIPYGVDTDFFKPQKAPLKGNALLCVGDACRDELTLIKAIKNLPVKLVRVSDEPKISEVYKKMAIGSQVCVLTGISDTELKKLYIESQLVIVPILLSANEPAGLTCLLEAMAMGKTVIVTKGLNSEDYVVADKTGVIVEPENPVALRNAILQLLGNDSKSNRIGNCAHQYIKDNFNMDINAEKLARSIRELMCPPYSS